MNENDVSSEAVVLSLLEARVLGCLIEKEATTPDVYPLSLNSLVNACNQKSNRSPQMNVGEDEVKAAIELLRDKHLVTQFSGAGARAIKYRHKFTDTWTVEPAAQAFMCELMLRGPQTTAGLRSNCERLAAVPDLAESETVLADLAERGMVTKLERQAGQKEGRWAPLIVERSTTEEATGDDKGTTAGRAVAAPVSVAIKLPAEAEARIAALENEVATLKSELAALRESLGG